MECQGSFNFLEKTPSLLCLLDYSRLQHPAMVESRRLANCGGNVVIVHGKR